jgi:hypothetical protein
LATGLLNTLTGSLSQSANDYIAKNAALSTFIQTRIIRSAELGVQYAEASEADRPGIAESMTMVSQTIINETVAATLMVEPALKDALLAALKTTFLFALQNLPLILALL